MSIFDNFGTTAWEIYVNAVEQFVGGSRSPLYIQPLALAPRVEFDTNYDMFNLYLKSKMSNDIPEWGPLYGRSLSELDDSYRAFLSMLNESVITQNGGNTADRLKELNKRIEEKVNGLKRLRKNLKEEYNDYSDFEDNPLSFKEWLNQQGYNRTLEITELEVQIANGEYLAAVNSAGSELIELARAQAALDSENSLIALPDSQEIAGKDPASWEKYLRQTIQVDIDKFKIDTNYQEFFVEEGQSRQTTTFTRWNAGGSFNYGWFNFVGAYAGADGSRFISEAQSSTKKIKISFQNVGQFPVTRGNWFNGSMLRAYAPRISKDFWSSTGRMPLILESVILVRGAQIEIETTDTYSKYIEEKWSRRAQGGFRIGPFSFGASAGSSGSRQESIVEKTSTGLKITDNSGRANILAVQSLRPVDLLPVERSLFTTEFSSEEAIKTFRSINDSIEPFEM